MPLYTYKCTKCENIETKIRKVTESDLPASCTDCGSTMRKTFDQSGTNFILKGDGWFKPTSSGTE